MKIHSKPQRLLPLLLSGTLFPYSSLHAVVTFDDGGMHTVNSLITDYIEIDVGAPMAATTVTFDTGAIVTGLSPFDETVYAEGTATIIINDGTFIDNVVGAGNSQFNISGGVFNQDLIMVEDAQATVSAGNFTDDIFTTGNADVTISGGIIIDDLEVFGGSTVTVNGGSFGEDIEVGEFATLTINGGTFTGGTNPGLSFGFAVANGGTLILNGHNFIVNGNVLGNGAITDLNGTISGILADGSAFSMPFDRDPDPTGAPGAFALIPEPHTATLFAFGFIGCMVTRRR